MTPRLRQTVNGKVVRSRGPATPLNVAEVDGSPPPIGDRPQSHAGIPSVGDFRLQFGTNRRVSSRFRPHLEIPTLKRARRGIIETHQTETLLESSSPSNRPHAKAEFQASLVFDIDARRPADRSFLDPNFGLFQELRQQAGFPAVLWRRLLDFAAQFLEFPF